MVIIEPIEGRKIILDVFADEGSNLENCKLADEMFQTAKTLGFYVWTPRFVFKGKSCNEPDDPNLPNPNITVTEDLRWAQSVYELGRDYYGLHVISLGSPIGKSKLEDVDDGNKGAKFMTLEQVRDQTSRVVDVARVMNASAIRAFTFYGDARRKNHNKGMEQAIEYMCTAADICKSARLLYVIEPETGLYGNNADNMIHMMEKARESGLENVVCLTDLANLHIKALDAVKESKKLMDSGFMVGAHAKAYGEACKEPALPSAEHTKLSHVPVGEDMAGTNYYNFFQNLSQKITKLNSGIKSLRDRGYNYPGFVVTLEPHLRGAGQFGGWSGPDGMGLARDEVVNVSKTYSIECVRERFPDFRSRYGLPQISK